MLNPSHIPGPGDAATWPPYAGRPGDPRHDEPEVTQADVSALADELSREPESVGDALEFIGQPEWDSICAAIARRNAEQLLAACLAATAPVLRDLARARLEASV